MKPSSKLCDSLHQSGQAMIEYAILLTVMVTLIAGGVELGLAAFNSNRTSEGAKAGSALWIKNGLNFAVASSTSGVNLVHDGTTYNNLAFLDHVTGPIGGRYHQADYASGTGESWGVGDHSWTQDDAINPVDTTQFYNPTCHQDGFTPADIFNDHSSGLPDDAAPEDLQHSKLDPASVSYDASAQRVYLFNPLPIDITECVEDLDDTDNFHPYSEFLEGRTYEATGTPNPPETYVSDNGVRYVEEFLPPVNRALLSLYVKECTDSIGDIIDCTKAVPASGDKVYLRLPGGRHVNNNARQMTQLGIFEEGPDEYAISTSRGQEDSSGTITGLLDSFRMHCRLPGVLNEFPEPTAPDNCRSLCYGEPDRLGDTDTAADNYDDYGPALPCDVRVIVRYRHIFESLVMMMQWKKPLAPNSRQYTDSPFDSSGNLLRGVIGTEINRWENETVLKAQRTFRGCYETSSVISKTFESGVLSGGNSIESLACN